MPGVDLVLGNQEKYRLPELLGGHLQEIADVSDALLAELRLYDIAPETIYIGGGTPSLLDDRLLARLLEAYAQARTAVQGLRTKD